MPALHPVSATTLLPAVARLLARGSSVRIFAEGSSMLPTLRPRIDSVTLRAPGDRPLRSLDIVLAYDSATGRYILHRVVRRPRHSLVTLRGDANLLATETLPLSAVIGVVSAIHRPGRPDASPRTFRARIRTLIHNLIAKIR